MKKAIRLLAALLCLFLLSGCAGPVDPPGISSAGGASTPASGDGQASTPENSARAIPGEPTALALTDSLGRDVSLSPPERVVSLYGSFAESWLLAGGTLCGTTEDAVSERKLDLPEDCAIVGTVKEPNLEMILSLNPDLVILSSDIAGHRDLDEALEGAGVPHVYYVVDTFDAYLAMLGDFCTLTGRDDLYRQNGLDIKGQIDALLARVPAGEGPTVLLLRAYSTGVKAKGADNLAGAILSDLHCQNVADLAPSLLEELSIEAIIDYDPDFIFVTTMGTDDEKAMAALRSHLTDNPAWAGLSAVKDGRFITLPKDLFHYKPNARWGESYAALFEILYAS